MQSFDHEEQTPSRPAREERHRLARARAVKYAAQLLSALAALALLVFARAHRADAAGLYALIPGLVMLLLSCSLMVHLRRCPICGYSHRRHEGLMGFRCPKCGFPTWEDLKK